MSADSPEQLLDAFRAAALCVTKLYKTAASGQTKARTDGYQDCLDDLLVYLDKENIGVGDGEGWKVRRWATERLVDGGRADAVSQNQESEDETGDKAETASSPETTRSGGGAPLSGQRSEGHMRMDSAPPVIQQAVLTAVLEEQQQQQQQQQHQQPEVVVPTRDTFSFQSPHPFPSDAYLNMDSLDLSDGRMLDTSGSPAHSTNTTPRASRTRHGSSIRSGSRSSYHLARGAGQKRKINFAEIFDLASLGYPKDPFGNGGSKRSRHA